MTKKQHRRQKGFTLIEMIAVLVIVGILTAIAGLGIVQGIQSYLFAKDNATISEKAQLAIIRLNRELLECYDCKGMGTVQTIPVNPFTFTNTLGLRSIQLDGTNIKIGTTSTTLDTLLGDVGTFTMQYNADKSITITIGSSIKPSGVTVPNFVTTVYPRNASY